MMLLSLTAALGLVYALWALYVLVMALKRVRDAGKLTTAMKVLGYPALAVGLVVDFIVNVLIASLLFLELPREWTVSSRLTRHINSARGWRFGLALWIAVNLLDALDPSGQHRT